MYEIIPGILEKDWDSIKRKIELVLPHTRAIHIDLIDGKFAPNTTFLDPEPFREYSSDVDFELHIMAEGPIQYLKPWADAGFKRFVGHIEHMNDQVEFVAQGQILGEVGLALDGPTSIEGLKVPFEDLDSVLVYTAEKAGASGATFLPERLNKIENLRSKGDFAIEVDGGVNDSNILQIKNAGATRFVSTSFIFSGDPRANLDTLKNLLSSS